MAMTARFDADRARSITGLIILTLATLGSTGCPSFGCGDLEPEVTPIEVADWNVTVAGLDYLEATAGNYDLEWDALNDEGRCRVACAVASDHHSALHDYDYDSMELDTCELVIPTADMEGVLNCTGTHTRTPFCVGGRRPLALAGEALEPGEGVGCRRDQLDAGAAMEQVSVTAFVELARQLRSLGAPAQLIERCEAAAEVEWRLVELLGELGARPPGLEPAAAGPETALLDIALHNATEGCVTETWAALLARHQAEHASAAAERRAFAEIAADEAGHADLAWALHDWLCTRLDADARAQVEAARERAIAELEGLARAQALAVPAKVRRELGLPEPRVAALLAREFGRRLSRAACAPVREFRPGQGAPEPSASRRGEAA